MHVPQKTSLAIYAAAAILVSVLLTSCSPEKQTAVLPQPKNAAAPLTKRTPQHLPSHLIVLSIWPGFLQGGGTSVGTLVLNAPAPKGGLRVQLSDDQTSAGIHVPSIVVVPTGRKLIDFPIRTAPVLKPVTCWITATQGPNIKTNTIQTRPALIIASPVVGGNAVGASIALHANAPASGAIVTLSSDSPLVQPPHIAKIHSGNSTLDISIPTAIVTTATSARISANIDGVKVTQNVDMLPIAATISFEKYATVRMQGEINLTIPTSKDLLFTIKSSDKRAVPTSPVVLKAGQQSATFTINVHPGTSGASTQIVAKSGVLTAANSLMIPPGVS